MSRKRALVGRLALLSIAPRARLGPPVENCHIFANTPPHTLNQDAPRAAPQNRGLKLMAIMIRATAPPSAVERLCFRGDFAAAPPLSSEQVDEALRSLSSWPRPFGADRAPEGVSRELLSAREEADVLLTDDPKVATALCGDLRPASGGAADPVWDAVVTKLLGGSAPSSDVRAGEGRKQNLFEPRVKRAVRMIERWRKKREGPCAEAFRLLQRVSREDDGLLAAGDEKEESEQREEKEGSKQEEDREREGTGERRGGGGGGGELARFVLFLAVDRGLADEGELADEGGGEESRGNDVRRRDAATTFLEQGVMRREADACFVAAMHNMQRFREIRSRHGEAQEPAKAALALYLVAARFGHSIAARMYARLLWSDDFCEALSSRPRDQSAGASRDYEARTTDRKARALSFLEVSLARDGTSAMADAARWCLVLARRTGDKTFVERAQAWALESASRGVPSARFLVAALCVTEALPTRCVAEVAEAGGGALFECCLASAAPFASQRSGDRSGGEGGGGDEERRDPPCPFFPGEPGACRRLPGPAPAVCLLAEFLAVRSTAAGGERVRGKDEGRAALELFEAAASEGCAEAMVAAGDLLAAAGADEDELREGEKSRGGEEEKTETKWTPSRSDAFAKAEKWAGDASLKFVPGARLRLACAVFRAALRMRCPRTTELAVRTAREAVALGADAAVEAARCIARSGTWAWGDGPPLEWVLGREWQLGETWKRLIQSGERPLGPALMSRAVQMATASVVALSTLGGGCRELRGKDGTPPTLLCVRILEAFAGFSLSQCVSLWEENGGEALRDARRARSAAQRGVFS